MLRNSPLRWPIWSSLLLTLPLLLMQSSGAQTQETPSKTSQLSDYLEIISTLQCSSKENGGLTPKQSAALTRRVVAQMRRQQLLSPNETVSCTCTKCVLTETVTQTTRCW